MSTEEKKTQIWRVIAVKPGRDLTSFADRLESALNELTREGREISINHLQDNKGAIIIGHKRLRMIELPSPPVQGQPQEEFQPSDKTASLVGPILHFMDRVKNMPDVPKLVQPLFEQLTRGVSVEELNEIAAECDKLKQVQQEHLKTCDNPNHTGEFIMQLDTITTMLRDKARAQLQ